MDPSLEQEELLPLVLRAAPGEHQHWAELAEGLPGALVQVWGTDTE